MDRKIAIDPGVAALVALGLVEVRGLAGGAAGPSQPGSSAAGSSGAGSGAAHSSRAGEGGAGERAASGPAGSELDDEIGRETAALRARFGGLAAGDIPHLRAARELYRATGLDPTKRRPSPEALLRRILRGDPFPRVHPAVDLGNLWGVLHGLPVGLYDLAKVAGPISLRLGRAGEHYEGIRKDDVHLEGRLVLTDDEGPFGNPSADSRRTSVDDRSRDLLYVLFAPRDFDAGDIRRWLAWLCDRAARDLGGSAAVL
jgi:DNA/RNA-binding domain of Phe-tRNA-synthetase-like protein